MSVRFSDYNCLWRKYHPPTWIAISKSSDTTLITWILLCLHVCTHTNIFSLLLSFKEARKKKNTETVPFAGLSTLHQKHMYCFPPVYFQWGKPKSEVLHRWIYLVCKFITYTFVELWIFIFWFTYWVILLFLVFVGVLHFRLEDLRVITTFVNSSHLYLVSEKHFCSWFAFSKGSFQP